MPLNRIEVEQQNPESRFDGWIQLERDQLRVGISGFRRNRVGGDAVNFHRLPIEQSHQVKKNGGIAHHEDEKLGHVGPNHRPHATHCRIGCGRQRSDNDAPARVKSGRLFEAHSRGRHGRAHPNRGDDQEEKRAGGTNRGMVAIFQIYHLTGQGCYHPPPARQLIKYISHDFEHWTESFCLGLRRGDPLYSAYGLNSGEQVHLGAAMWNRGNVVIGIYGKWNGHPSNDRRLVTLDLGLAVTNDGLH